MTYVWRCKHCGVEVAVVRKYEDRDETPACNECSAAGHKCECYDKFCGTDWERVIATANFSLNGKGWARDGYSK